MAWWRGVLSTVAKSRPDPLGLELPAAEGSAAGTMQEAGKNLERSHAMGARIANEERRLIEAVQRSEAWATCSSLVLGVEMELSIGVSTIDSFDDWHSAQRSLFVCCSTASMLCMGWVAYLKGRLNPYKRDPRDHVEDG